MSDPAQRFAPAKVAPGTPVLPLATVDGRPVPTEIRSGNGKTKILGGYVNAMKEPYENCCNWAIYAEGLESDPATGTRANKRVREGGSVPLTLDLAGPVYGPGAHLYVFEERR